MKLLALEIISKDGVSMTVNSEKEEIQLQKRMAELADKSFRQNMYCFTDFMGLAEQTIYYRMEKELSFSHPALFGGDEQAERKILRFGEPQELGYEEEYPIICIHIKPLLLKFADDFTHRDFLGALMNLGIERECIGDIRVVGREGYVYCLTKISDYICNNLLQIKHTHVSCEKIEKIPKAGLDEPESLDITVSSLRVDVLISRVYNLSRTESINQFREKKVYIDGRLNENNSKIAKPGETINVRGFGKFLFQEVKYETKKGKICISVAKFG